MCWRTVTPHRLAHIRGGWRHAVTVTILERVILLSTALVGLRSDFVGHEGIRQAQDTASTVGKTDLRRARNGTPIGLHLRW